MAKTYPDIPWPSNNAADALDGTTHNATQVPYVAQGTDDTSSPTLNQQENRNLQRLLDLLGPAVAGLVMAETTALDIGVFPVEYSLAGTAYAFNGATGQAVTDDDTSYVYLTSAGLQIVTDATGWPADATSYIPLAEVTAASGAITEVKDVRWRALNMVTSLGTLTATTSATVQLDSGSGGPKLKAETATRFGLRNAADGAYVDLQVLNLNAAAATLSGNLSVAGTAAVTGATTFNGAVNIANPNGLDVNPGSDIDADLITVGVTGTPKLSWDESENGFVSTHNLQVASGAKFKMNGSAGIVPFCPSHLETGGLTASSVLAWEYVAPVDFSIKNVTGRVGTAPAGAALIVDVRVNGTSIFNNVQADMVNIAAGAYQGTSATANSAVTAGDIITLEVEQVGSGTAGSDLTIVLNGRTELQE